MPTAPLNGTELHWRDAGRGTRAVVLLHAFPLHAGMWSRQIEALAATHRVVAPDFRGLGGTSGSPEPSTMALLAGDVRALLAHLRIERAAVAGLSMGGYLALELWRQAPGLFTGLALCDTKAGADTPEGAAGREAFARSALTQGLHWVADQMTPKLLKPAPDAAAVAEVRRLIGEGTPVGVAAAQRGMAVRPDSTPTLATITCPTLVVVGAEDGLTPPSEAEKLAAGIRGATMARLPGAGHLSNIEQPAAFNEALSRFLAGLAA
jgi:pimeloyl-ACP methyl ester carboxylesterase